MSKSNVFQTVLATAACKFTRFILRKTGRGGTAVPGIVAMKISRNILETVSEGMEIILVTGTNGKTTTCNMIEHALSEAGYTCLLNKSGANMLHGMAADLICNSTWLGRPRFHYAVLECDEAALKLVAPQVHPKVITVTNLFSDQVDRYGGVENTLKEIRTGVERSPQSTLVLNADEPLSASLSKVPGNKVLWFGLEKEVGRQGNIDLADAGSCPVCGGTYEWDYNVYAHLGGFSCPKCGWKRQSPDVAVTSIDRISAAGSTVHMRADNKTQEVNISLPAVYNVYNAAAAVCTAAAMGISAGSAMASLGSVRSSFGRLETFKVDDMTLQMILVKNPAGCNQAFSYLTGLSEDFSAVLCLNNRTGDGHDISWINQTDYEKLCLDPHLKKIYVGGDCKDELYKRLKEAGARESIMETVSDYQQLVEALKQDHRTVFILPNYTAMMEIRQVLVQETGSKDFWE